VKRTTEAAMIAYQNPEHPSYHGRKTVTCYGCGEKCSKSAWGNWCHPCNVERMDRISATLGGMASKGTTDKPMMPTEQQISAAHEAWERTVTQWRLRKVSNYGMAGDLWLLENDGSPMPDAGRVARDEIAAHKFEGGDAEKKARFMLRDKCIVAMLNAVLAKQE
jgi:hypothetical protein